MRRRRQKKYRREAEFHLNISPKTKRSLLAVFFFGSGSILLLSLIGFAGDAGEFLNSGLGGLFGQARFIFALSLLGFAMIQFSPTDTGARRTSAIGLVLLLAGVLATLHSFAYERALGGYLGFLLGAPLVRGFGRWGATIIGTAIVLASLLLTFNASIEQLAEHGRFLGRLAGALLAPVGWIRNLLVRPRKPRILEGGELIDPLRDEPSFISREITFLKNKKKKETPLEETEPAAPAPSEFSLAMKSRRRRKIDLPLNLLNEKTSKPTAGDIKKNMEIIEKTLAHFGIAVQMGDVSVGPTVTQFTFKPQEGIKLTRITALGNDLALALAAHPIRMEAPIPGKSLVGIEVPNQTVATVGLREILDTPVFRERKSQLELALGKDVAGHPWFANLPHLPHLLVAGSTGSGKTVCLNAMIVSLLYQNSPDDLKLILIDPKRVELPIYNGIPHLLVPTITDVPKTINALKWTIAEMERRFMALEAIGAKDITYYNERSNESMPALIIVVDELADLMATAARDIEAGVIRIAQMARAVGIHLILATQRPSVDVITGLIKANIPARIAFAVASQTDSRTILDTSGAEKLLGRGDMLFTAPELSKPRRIQGAFVSDEEIRRVVQYLKTEYEAPEYDPTITEKQAIEFSGVISDGGDGDDPLIPEAKEVILEAGKASASLLQRRLKVGYARAARLLDLLEAEGFIGPGEGAKPREVLAALGSPTVFKPSEEEEADKNQVPPWE